MMPRSLAFPSRRLAAIIAALSLVSAPAAWPQTLWLWWASRPRRVATVLVQLHDRAEVRAVFRVGEAFFVWAHWKLPETAKRILPHGRVGPGGPSYISRWEPVLPEDWQPAGAETPHEKIARLEQRIYSLTDEQSRIAETHRLRVRALEARIRSQALALKSIATAASDAATE